jgi:hypothetical protein
LRIQELLVTFYEAINFKFLNLRMLYDLHRRYLSENEDPRSESPQMPGLRIAPGVL